MTASDHKQRTAEQIITEGIFHDAKGFGYRAASWLDLVKRTGQFAALHYASIDGRLAIEHLVFEQIITTAGAALTEENYKRLLSEPRKLSKLLEQIVPDHEKLQDFTEIIGSLSSGIPRVNKWNIKKLMRSWGILSSYLHWSGSHIQTTESPEWQGQAIQKVAQIIEPLWEKIKLCAKWLHVYRINEASSTQRLGRLSSRNNRRCQRPNKTRNRATAGEKIVIHNNRTEADAVLPRESRIGT